MQVHFIFVVLEIIFYIIIFIKLIILYILSQNLIKKQKVKFGLNLRKNKSNFSFTKINLKGVACP